MIQFRLLEPSEPLSDFVGRCGSSWEGGNVRALSVFEDQRFVDELTNSGSTADDPSRHGAHACLLRILATRLWRCRPREGLIDPVRRLLRRHCEHCVGCLSPRPRGNPACCVNFRKILLTPARSLVAGHRSVKAVSAAEEAGKRCS